MKILIIDDEQDLCLLLKRYLERNTHQAETAHTLQDGLKTAEAFQPELIFLDNNLPDGFGINYVDKLKNAVKHAKVVMLSAMQPMVANDIPTLDAFVEKPVSMLKIKQVLATVSA